MFKVSVMPIYVYRTKSERKGCDFCQGGFEILQGIKDAPLKECPRCGSEITKVFGSFFTGASKTGLDSRAKEKGFHKLKKVDKGKYEKLY